ncbi:uncharacterized protein LOC123540829 [Mercenaria mercenaria]|uniref:uncharacterized protein LOC123540829 n=1 Tax=Mercenaria mercenaria TaxID=6596 RepID=UPI00234F23D3|nr:uncharacterized protein LOC123540829 [Mercenaria mercenaria]
MKENMVFSVFVLLVSISCCSTTPPGKGYLYDNRFYLPYNARSLPRPTRTPVTTPANPETTPTIVRPTEEDERLANEIGVKVPPDDCVISWEDFIKYVVNRDYIGIYGINDDDALNPGVPFKASIKWNVVNETTMRRRVSLWDSGTNKCLFADGLFRRVDESRAIFGLISGNIFATANRKDYLVCGKDYIYCIFFICFDSQNNRQGRCHISQTVLLVRDQRDQPPNSEGVREQQIRLNDIPWTNIDNDFQKCFGQTFVDDKDPQIFYTWKNPSCAVPGTAQFDEGVLAG